MIMNTNKAAAASPPLLFHRPAVAFTRPPFPLLSSPLSPLNLEALTFLFVTPLRTRTQSRIKSGEIPTSIRQRDCSLRYATITSLFLNQKKKKHRERETEKYPILNKKRCRKASIYFGFTKIKSVSLKTTSVTGNSRFLPPRMVRSSPEAPEATSASSNHTKTTTRLALSIFSYNGNVMLAAIISLLLVILFLLLLHIYAKWFLLRARRRRIRRQGSPLTGFLRGFHHFQTFSSFDAAACPAKGLDPSLIASIPIFLYKRNPAGFRDDDDDRIRQDLGLECVICLSDFEEDDIGRALAKCGHAFHAECIDMWLHSHTTCPICRAPAVYVYDGLQETNNDDAARGESVREVMGATRDWETVIDVEEDNDGSMDREEEEVVSVVMIVSVSVSRAGSARRLAEEDCSAE